MPQENSLQSLDLILEDVSAEINLSINSLDQYSRSKKSTKSLKKCLQHLNKLKGVFALLEMVGAQRLVLDVVTLIKDLSKRDEPSQTRLLEVISTALARLMRYTEHVNQKACDIPQLLIPTINFLRTAVNASPLSESAFFDAEFNTKRKGKDIKLVTSEATATKSRHFRQMYQIGLIEVLRQTNLLGGLKMMQKSLDKLDEECLRPSSPNLWYIAHGMLEGYIDNQLTLTKQRLKLLSRIDRQIRKIENKPENLLDDNKLELNLLTKEMLYLAWISDSSSQSLVDLYTHFKLKKPPINDARLRKELEELRGPSDQDYHSIAEALIAEIFSIRKTLDLGRENNYASLDLEQAMKQMVNLNNLLKILQVDDQIIRLSVAIDLVKKAHQEENQLTEKDCNILNIVLESISNAVEQSELSKYSGKRAQRREKLSKAQQVICDKTHMAVKQLIEMFIEFTSQKRKVSLLKQAGTLLAEIQKGFEKLRVEEAVSILNGCQVFMTHHLIKKPHTTSEDSINLYADIIGSLEFYLETLKFTAKPSSRILEFAENSLLHLNRLSNKR